MKYQTNNLLMRVAGGLALALALAGGLRSSAEVIPTEPDHVQSLDGQWRFKLEQSGGFTAAARLGTHLSPVTTPATFEPFQQPDYQEGREWTNLAVPGNWEMAGLSPATYYQPDNASGFYRYQFTVPSSWQGRDVFLNFDGVQNGAEIWLNGKPVAVNEPSWGRGNYHESGWTAFQANLTPQVKFGETNLLALRVTKNTESSDLDSGDYFFLGGIYRPVTLFSVPRTHLSDMTVQTRLLANDRAEVKVLVSVTGTNAVAVSLRLKGLTGAITVPVDRHGHAALTQIVDHPKLWSAEFPNLYQLVVQLKDADWETTETVSKKIGIREVTIRNGVLLVNGTPVKLAGICRHDVSAEDGTAVGPDLWRKDISLMKAANINAIRTSHYPYGSGFYDLCDELGMYVVDELPYCWCPTDDPKTTPAFEQRARETIRRDKNHPSVIIWTIGNENKAGRNLQTVADLVKKLDPTRPRAVSCFDGEKYGTELSDAHYPTIQQMINDVPHSRETGRPHIYLEHPNTWDVRLGADPGAWERWGPVLQRTWDICLKYDTIPGTFLWEWQDRDVADHFPTKLYSYYPESGINLVKIKGLVDGFRDPRPWLYDVKMVYSPIQISNTFVLSAGKVSFPVANRYSFTDLSALKLAWKLESDGQTIAFGDDHIEQPPLTDGQVELALPKRALAKADALQVEFIHPDGDSVVAHRFDLKTISPAFEIRPVMPAGLPIPEFHLVTRETKRDANEVWKQMLRVSAHLTNVVQTPSTATSLDQLRELTATVVGGAKGRVLGRLWVDCSGSAFSYRLQWTGRREDVLELGWVFHPPAPAGAVCDHFSWDRTARWTVYPDHHIGRAEGTATPASMQASLAQAVRADDFDFDSTKYDCNQASLATAAGDGLCVAFDPKQRFHCRAGAAADGNGYVLYVNQYVCPPDDISKPIVPEFYFNPKVGDIIEGHFAVGTRQTSPDIGGSVSNAVKAN